MQSFSVRHWTSRTGLAEAAGFAIPALAGAAASRVWFLPEASPLAFWAIMVCAGACEGFVLGATQAKVLGRSVQTLDRRGWTLATVLGAAFAWSLGLLPSSLAEFGVELTTGEAIALYGPLGIILLFSLGVAQWLVLRRAHRPAAPWIWWSALAWLAGLPFPFLFLAAVPNGAPVWAFVLAGVAAGIAMAFAVAAVTGCGLQRMLRPRLSEFSNGSHAGGDGSLR